MLKINKVGLICLLLFSQICTFAQNNTNSPYTRYGLGLLADRSFGAGRAMGGIGYGLRSSKQINPMNPASYSSLDSLTFMFDFGSSGQVFWYNDGINKQKSMNGNIEYLAMQFPIMKGLAMSVGLLPYSFVGYDFGADRTTDEGVSYTEQFVGSGGLSDLYGGISYDIWRNRLAIGANIGFLFGDITHEQNIIFPSTSGSYSVYRSQEINIRDVKMEFGVQYTQPFSKTEKFTVGVVYSPSNRMNAKMYNVTQQYLQGSSSSSDVQADTITGLAVDLPNSFGAGISYTKENKMMAGIDVLYENWENALFLDEEGQYKNRLRIGAGLEFIPNHMKKLYFNRIRFRVGIHYSDSYINVRMQDGDAVRDCGYKEYGVSVGFGFPIRDFFWGKESLVNVSFEYVKIKPEIRAMIDEQYFRFTLNYSFSERWFDKRKLN